jgi:EpsI family protein
MTARAVILSVVLLVGALGVQVASRSERVPARDSLSSLPTALAQWQGEPTERFDQQILTVLGVDDYLNRVYVNPAYGSIGFYIGYYKSQRENSKLHSPMVCLPGAGWEMQANQLRTIPVTTSSGSRSIVVNRLIIAKGLERQVVLYWYQSQGRVIANEYWGKLYSMLDAATRRRTDTAIVRVISPVLGSDAQAEARAERAATKFTQAVFPLLGKYLPD